MTDEKADLIIGELQKLNALLDELTRPQRALSRSVYEDARIVNDIVRMRVEEGMTEEEVPDMYREIVAEEVNKVRITRGLPPEVSRV